MGNETTRAVSEGAEKWLGVEIPVLDHGFVKLVDYMGNDQSIEAAARVSYSGAGTRKVSETRGLLRYLMRNRHTSPFEMMEMVFHMKMPIFVARQIVRHRTASLNEISGRYSILDDEIYVPRLQDIAWQSGDNKQGRGAEFELGQAEEVIRLLKSDAALVREHYEWMLNDDGKGSPVDPNRGMLARELARIDLTLNSYTQWIWKMDLHNLFHFLGLRMDAHAQLETRRYADAMAVIVMDSAPISFGAFVDYELNAVRLTGLEVIALTKLFRESAYPDQEIENRLRESGVTNKRELDEAMEKMRTIGLSKGLMYNFPNE